ncbi:MAG TPA: type II secretion system protein GspG [Planctomycetota bacterium]|nr:type II secretion system protein GspG [Planctomycetota bacterium]
MAESPRRSARGAAAAMLFGAVVLLSAGVIAPALGSVDDAPRREAADGAARIAAALRDFLDDCAEALREGRAGPPERLYGPGVQPDCGAFGAASGFPLSGVLCRDGLGLGASWRGPYLPSIPIDPWGRAYVVTLGALSGAGDLMVVSAGEDGVVDSARLGRVDDRDVGVTLIR